MEHVTPRVALTSTPAPGIPFNPRTQLTTRMPADGYLDLGAHVSVVPSMVGAIRVSKARTPNIWERHDAGDEVLILLSGVCTMTLRDGEGRTIDHTLNPGDVLIIPSGIAHRAELHSDEVQVLFVTPRSGTAEWSEQAQSTGARS